MSTDYGFRCRQCGQDFMPDNLRRGNVLYVVKHKSELMEFLGNYKSLEAAAKSLGFDIEIFAYWVSSAVLIDMLEWLVTHNGHDVVVIDEYGKEHVAVESKPQEEQVKQ